MVTEVAKAAVAPSLWIGIQPAANWEASLKSIALQQKRKQHKVKHNSKVNQNNHSTEKD